MQTILTRIYFWFGVFLIIVGLTIFGWIGWQLIGTNIVSHHHQQQSIEKIRKNWEKENKKPDHKIIKSGILDGEIIKIPRFGKNWEMPVLNNTSENALAAGVAHFPETADAGQVGNFVVAAHRITHGEPFRNFPSLQKDDRIIVETRTTIYTYVLDVNGTTYVVPFTSNWVLGSNPLHSKYDHLITLVTCSELFHTDNRSVTFGHLISIDQK